MLNFEKAQVAAAEYEREFEHYISSGIAKAYAIVEKRFEKTTKRNDRLPFHNTEHTFGDVVPRTEQILTALRENGADISERDILIGKLAAAWHDVAQEWEPQEIKEGVFQKITRKRFVGKNEEQSAEQLVQYMENVNKETGEKIFTPDDMDVAREVMRATIPGFGVVNPEEKDVSKQIRTVTQPNLTRTSSFVARAVALADLGSAGMDGKDAFQRDGDTLFREENLDILDALKKKDITETQKEYMRKRMLGWTRFQAVFAEGRKMLLEKELEGIEPPEAKEAIRIIFSKFGESIASADSLAKRREKMSFEELARDFGY